MQKQTALRLLVYFAFKCLLIGLGVAVAAGTSAGIHYDSYETLFWVCLLIGLLNAFLRPILIVFTLPFVVFTLGLGIIVINALLILMTGAIVDQFEVASFWHALWAAVWVGLISLAANLLLGGSSRPGRFRYSATVVGPDGKVKQYGNDVPPPGRRLRDRGRKGDEDVIDISSDDDEPRR